MCHNNIICKLLSLSLSFLQWQSYNTSTCIVNLPKASKSLLLIAASISLILCGTIMSALCCSRDQVHHREKKKWGCTLSRELVWTVVLIPRVLLTDFFWSLTTSMITWSSGQCVWGATCIAKLSDPSSLSPLSHVTNPPYILRQALPEPCLCVDKKRGKEVKFIRNANSPCNGR